MSQIIIEIIENLEKIDELLDAIIQPDIKTDFTKIAASLAQHLPTLQTQLSHLKNNDLSYEFFEVVSDIVENITEIRLKKDPKLDPFIIKLNQLAEMLRMSVYKHEALVKEFSDESIYTTPATTSIDEANKRLEKATQKAQITSAAAEKASNEGMKYMMAIQDLAKKGKTVPSKLANESIQHTFAMYAKNTAAILATDEMTAIVIDYEKLQNRH